MEEVTRLVSSGDCVKIWDSASMTVLEQLNPHSATHPVAQVCWSSNNQYLVSASSIGDKLVVTNVKSSPVPVVELAEGKKQTRVSLNSSSQYLVSGGLDNAVHIWDLKSKRLHRTLKDHKEAVTCVSFNSSDNYVASGSSSGDIILHSVATNLSSKAFGHGTNQPIHDLKYSVVKRALLGTVSDSGTVVLWDTNTQKELHAFDGAHKAPASGLAFSPANDLLFVTVGLDKKIICYDTSSKIILRSMRVESPLTAIDFTPDGTGLVVGSTQGRLYMYDLRNLGTPTKTVIAHKTSVTCLRFQSSHSRHVKSSKVASSKSSNTHSSKRISAKLGSSISTTPPPPSHTGDGHAQGTGPNVEEVFFREAEGQQGADCFPSTVGRNSMDIFSPVREGGIRANGTSLEFFPREGEGQLSTEKGRKVGRNSLDIFSPVREGVADVDFIPSYSGGPPHRKTPLGIPRSFSPLNVQTPPIIEEEAVLPATPLPAPLPAPTDTCNTKRFESSGSCLEGEGPATPTSSRPTHSQPAAPFTPELSLRRANDVQAQLSYDMPHNGTLPSAAPAGASRSSALATSLSERIVETIGPEGAAAPLTSLQIQFIRNMIHDTLEDFRDACHRDIVNLQVEMVKQFYIQLNEIHGLIEKYSVNDTLVEEIEKLKEENKRLRANY